MAASSSQTLPRTYSHPNPYASSAYARRDSGATSNLRIPRVLKRLFKFPQMDFEVAIWEMTSLMIAPRKVFRNMYYQKQTKNTYHSADPAFPYLLTFFLLLASLAWSLAYATPSLPNILRIAFFFTIVHCLALSLLLASAAYFLVPRLFGPAGLLRHLALPGGRSRARGLFTSAAGGATAPADELEFGFCFDVAVRAFLPVFLWLYMGQFLLLPVLTSRRVVAVAASNALHVGAYAQALYITFLGYSSLPFLSGTHLMLVPGLVALAVAWVVATAAGWSASLHLAPVLWCAGGLRKSMG